jgi:hypothetical protein
MISPTCIAHLKDAQKDLEGMVDCKYEMTRSEYSDVMLILDALRAVCYDLSGGPPPPWMRN